MASKQFCDRCGGEVEEYTSVNNVITIPLGGVDLTTKEGVKTVKTSRHLIRMDICDQCRDEVKVFMGMDVLVRIEEGKQ